MQSELKPCPFCGGEAGKVFFLKGHTPASIGDTQHSETCPLAFSWSGFYRPTPEEAIAAWNTRASDAERREPDANENPYSRARLNSENTKLRAELERNSHD